MESSLPFQSSPLTRVMVSCWKREAFYLFGSTRKKKDADGIDEAIQQP
jgi:hypothetical protein